MFAVKGKEGGGEELEIECKEEVSWEEYAVNGSTSSVYMHINHTMQEKSGCEEDHQLYELHLKITWSRAVNIAL